MSVDRIDPRGSNDDRSMSASRGYNDDELMAVLLSREVRDGEVVLEISATREPNAGSH